MRLHFDLTERRIADKGVWPVRDDEMTIEQLRDETRRLRERITDLESQLAERERRVATTQGDDSKREAAEAALRASEQQFRNIVEASPMGIHLYRLDPDGRLELVTVNPAAETITGVRADTIVGKPIEEAFLHLAGTDAPDQYRHVASTGEPWTTSELHYEDGKISGAFEVYAVQSTPGNVVVMFSDVTQRKRDDEERLALEAQVQHVQKLESLGVLAGGIAHDFNNLLMGILGNADLALNDLSPTSPVRSNLEEIRSVSGRAAELCKQMLAYSGKGRFVVEPISISDIVEEMAHMLEVAISKKAVLKYEFAVNVPTIMADATQMRQVIMNLITNASEAIGDRSGIISITTGAMDCDRDYLTNTYLAGDLPEGLYVTLQVSDTGCGMDSDSKERIFEPFFTTKFTGRGLGLAAVLGIIRGHEGAIRVYSELGRGTTFRLLLPATDIAAMPRPKPVQADQWQGTGRVLLADDEETVRTVGKQMLERVGFDVIVAADGREAVELFDQQHDEIVCVILDLTMPHMDGEQAFREMRRISRDVRVIMSSGYNEQEVTQRFVGTGLAGFLQKPYRLQDLAEKVREILTQ